MRRYLEGAGAALASERVDVTVDVREGEPAEEIAAAAADWDPALVVMATHARTGMKRALLGSVAGEVLQRAGAPVLLLRPSGSQWSFVPIARTVRS